MSTVSLRMKVERPDRFKTGYFKVLFRQELEYDSSVSIPFLSCMKVYGCSFRTRMQL